MYNEIMFLTREFVVDEILEIIPNGYTCAKGQGWESKVIAANEDGIDVEILEKSHLQGQIYNSKNFIFTSQK